MSLNEAQLHALSLVRRGMIYKWRASGRWSHNHDAHALTLNWLLRNGYIRIESSTEPWCDAVLTPVGRAALAVIA